MIFVFLAVTSVALGSVVFLLSSNGLVAALSTIGSLGIGATINALVANEWRKRADAYAAAARGIDVDPVELAPGGHDPQQLATEVKSTLANAQRMSSKVSQLNLVIDGLAEGVLLTDGNAVVIEHNPAVEHLAGRKLNGVLLHDAFFELKAPVQQALEQRESTRLVLERTRETKRQVLSAHVAPLTHGVGASVIFFDITELRRLEQVRTDFVANVSHELRTPLTALRGYAETLQSGAILDAQIAPQMVAVIHRQAMRLSELVDDLLQLSKLESKLFHVERNPIGLREIALNALEGIEPTAHARFNISISDSIEVLGDARALEQVMLNLFENAIRHSGSEGTVEVSARLEHQNAIFDVKDVGKGISAEHLPRLFERFYRVDLGRSREAGGTGLGLSIVKHLVSAMGGEVSVRSMLGQGSTFGVTLPRPSFQTESIEPK